MLPYCCEVIFLLLLCTNIAEAGRRFNDEEAAASRGTNWAILVAGSSGYVNYRHQADVCHAYQILKKGGMKDENIIVFMYDDIAHNEENPTPGIIINKPNGPDVYAGVPKDYTKSHTTAHNFYAVLLGNKSALTGGSGKVVKSGPNDHIFIYYADHGSPGLIGMPVGDYVYAKDFMAVLKKKHQSGSYKNMVIYVEACEAGSLFKGLLPNNFNIYVTTASNQEENSYGTYCPGDDPRASSSSENARASSPDDYGTCLGDLYSIAWMEDSDGHDMHQETLQAQYQVVKKRTTLSHVMQYGYLGIEEEFLSNYMGSSTNKGHGPVKPSPPLTSSPISVSQRDASRLYLQHKIKRAAEGSPEKLQAQKRLQDEMSNRERVDRTIKSIEEALSSQNSAIGLNAAARPAGKPLVDDWDCFKKLVRKYEQSCGKLSSYGKKYTGAFANMCNAGIDEDQMASISNQVCT
ncbi:vacuolar-processing enzyme-like [Punica granatum]|uniref:Uncharacterized protein n=2 Tax=Punica granatum TaxID=22663 RepID=A0A2I0JWW9_PUNGR|nr:vacuolar-processing enzyme-like [Punica granatum]PKI60808.1 hypothetical protein CRG98_018797 [Punica granatum]